MTVKHHSSDNSATEQDADFLIKALRSIPELRTAKAKYCGPNLIDSVGVALLCWFQLAALGATAALTSSLNNLFLETTIYLYVIVFSARALRGLEGMFHEGSHRLFHKSMKVNDRLTNFLGGAIFGKTVQSYRPPHWEHHRFLGSEAEADRTNYERRNFATLDRSNMWKFALGILRCYPLFFWDWYNEIRQCRIRTTTILISHIAIFIGLYLALDLSSAFLIIMMTIWLPILLVLPALRLIGESEEHPYEKIPTTNPGPQITFDATLNNIGIIQQIFIHPFGDCWHIVHHLVPTCRQIRQRAVHKLLLKHSQQYRQVIQIRTRVLEEEKQYAK